MKFVGPATSSVTSFHTAHRYCLLFLFSFFSSDVDCCNHNTVLFPFSAILSRGPTTGLQGKVLLAFEDNVSSKIGVRFDRPIVDGNDLGGLCEKDRGFFCTGNFPFNIYAFASKVNCTNDIRCVQLLHFG